MRFERAGVALLACTILFAATMPAVASPMLPEHGSSFTAVPRPGRAPGGNTNRLPPGVPLPPGTQLRGQHLDASESMPLASEGESGWSIDPSPNVTDAQATNYLTDVTCVSEMDCWAVGASYLRTVPHTLIEHWDGTAWEIVPSPNTVASKPNVLSRVTCISASDCWAVGWHVAGNLRQTLIEHWDGESWSIAASPNAGGSSSSLLTDVSCVSAADCWAVGYYHRAGTAQTLIEHWDGDSWSIVTSPNTAASNNNFLSGLTCLSASDCWAVGSSDTEIEQGIFHALIEHWDGTSWSITASPIGAFVQPNHLAEVTCTASSDCWAVGWQQLSNGQQTLIVRWDGTSWSSAISPNGSPVHSNVLHSVDCTSPSDCWAVGSQRTGGVSVSGVGAGTIVEQTLIEHWDGASWSIVTSPNTNPARANALLGVSCRATSECWAVGNGDSAGAQTLVERWDGSSWSIVASPNVGAGETSNLLVSVACPTPSQCLAVGGYYTGSVQQTLIQQWDGTSWSIVASPNTSSSTDNFLTGVACPSASDCWAVGYSDNGAVRKTLVQHWNGTSWAIVASPDVGAQQDGILSGVTCVSASDCWAVGTSGSDAGNAVYQTLIEHWDGSSWSIIPSPNSTMQGNLLSSVACISASDCWTVGHSRSSSVRQTLIEHWDGASWSIVTSPTTGPTDVLTSVACVAVSDCWAVGHSNTTGANQTLILRWDGTSWAIVTSPNTSPSQSNFLFGVSCASASECWVVGYFSPGGGVTQTLIEEWDGTSWAIVDSPNHTAARSQLLLGIDCALPSDCRSVGFHHTGTNYQTLIVRNSSGAIDPTPTASPTLSPSPSESPQPDIADVSFTDNTAGSGQHSDETRFEARLTDSNGDPLAGRPLSFELVGKGSRTFTATTNEDGVAAVTPRLGEEPGPHQLTVRFAGDEEHVGDADTVSFVVNKEDSALVLSVQGEDDDKSLRVRLSDLDASSEGIAERTIAFYSDGELIGSTETDADGVASFALPSRHRGNNRTYEAVFAGDDFYLGSSDERAGKGNTGNGGGGGDGGGGKVFPAVSP